jgi:hypothetical protein
MERLLEFLNDEAWWGFRSSSFGEEQTTRTARGGLDTSCPKAALAQSAPRESWAHPMPCAN